MSQATNVAPSEHRDSKLPANTPRQTGPKPSITSVENSDHVVELVGRLDLGEKTPIVEEGKLEPAKVINARVALVVG
jgi:hypothetical protein